MATPAAIVQAGAALPQAIQAALQIKDRLWDNKGKIHDRAPKRVIKRNGPDITEFGTLRKPLKDIVEWLRNGCEVKGIGIHGIPGIGKTTIMENLNDHVQVAKMFHIVMWLEVSKGEGNISSEILAEELRKRLKLSTETRDLDEVARRIYEELEGKKYLLLLDDVREPLKLREIGIPDSNNGSKIVLTTRDRLVCKLMNLDKEIRLKHLPRREAWTMFENEVGNKGLTANPKIYPIASKVCDECYGLPLLIKMVAPTFRSKTNVNAWEGVLDNWRNWSIKNLEGIRQLYEMMRLCYIDLKDERHQKCFLYGALYPEDININTDSLLECWEAEGLLANGDDERKDRVKAGYETLLRLQNVSFLKEEKRDYHVTMDKFIRQVALYISEGLCEIKHLVETNKKLSDPPNEESWSEKNRISLGANELDRLPSSPNCKMLSTLFLQANKVLKEIPPEFFNRMTKLRVLELSDTGIKSLPSSLQILRKLKVLHLNNCKQLVELPSNIEGLEDLEFLDIHGSGISGIPSDIKKLKLLKHLRVSFGNYNVISELSELEELVIDFEKLEQWTDVAETLMKKVATLEKFKKLRVCFLEMIVDVIEVVEPKTLCINVPKAGALLSYIRESSWKEVRKITLFQFFIGLKKGECFRNSHLHCEKYVKYCNGDVSDKIDTPILEVLAEAEGLELVGHKDMTQLSDFVTSNMDKIQGFLIDSCDAMETIIDTGVGALLPNLEQLFIKNLPKLKSIWKKGPLQFGFQVTTLVISKCPLLTKVFPSGMSQQLSVIRYLTIEKCDKVKEIFSVAGANADQLELPNLEELVLLDMTKLGSICAMPLRMSSLEKLTIFECPGLHRLPFNKENVENLNCIEAEEKWWGALQLQEDKEELEKLCSFG